MVKIGVVVVAAMLVACGATPPQPYFSQDILVVPEADLPKFWVHQEEKVRFAMTGGQRLDLECGYVITRFIIDSNGEVFNAEIVESDPPNTFDRAELTKLAKWKFVAAPANSRRIPVQVETKTLFKQAGQQC